jgi:hypothetical protein
MAPLINWIGNSLGGYGAGSAGGDILIYIIGQSNAGTHEATTKKSLLYPRYTGTNNNVLFWDGVTNGFVTYDSTTNTNQFPASTRNDAFGLEMSLGVMLNRITGKNVYFVKEAVGTTGFAVHGGEDWNDASTGELKDDFTDSVTSAKAWLATNGVTVDELGIYQLIGETDASTEVNADAYGENCLDTANSIIAAIGKADIQYNIVQLHDATTVTYKSTIRDAQAAIVAKTPINSKTINTANVRLIDVDALASNNLHFFGEAQMRLGETEAEFVAGRTYAAHASTSGTKTVNVINVDVVLASGQNSTILTEGVDYTLPVGASATNTYVEFKGTFHTGQGLSNAGVVSQIQYSSIYIDNPENILTSIDIKRAGNAGDAVGILEIKTYVGSVSGVNEWVVRKVGKGTGTNVNQILGDDVTTISDNTKCVVFITSQSSAGASQTVQNEALWTTSLVAGDVSGYRAQMDRLGSATTTAMNMSYAIVEYTGSNWNVTREVFTTTGTLWANGDGYTKTKFDITLSTPLTDYTKAFCHTQFATDQASSSYNRYGDAVGIKSNTQLECYNKLVTAVRKKVVWIIENSQADDNKRNLEVQHIDIADESGGSSYADNRIWEDYIDSVVVGETSAYISASTTGSGMPSGFISYQISGQNTIEFKESESAKDRRFLGQIVIWPEE